MISGARVFFLACLLVPLRVSAQSSADLSVLSVVMHNLADVRSASGHFVEDKYIQSLTEPLQSEGTLSYKAPDHVEKLTTSPERERLAVTGGELTIERDGQSRTLDLSDHPEIQAFVESVRSTLAGDLPALQQYYTVGFSGTPAKWQLLLQPNDSTVQQMVTSIRIAGKYEQLDSIETLAPNGDRSEMTITP